LLPFTWSIGHCFISWDLVPSFSIWLKHKIKLFLFGWHMGFCYFCWLKWDSIATIWLKYDTLLFPILKFGVYCLCLFVIRYITRLSISNTILPGFLEIGCGLVIFALSSFIHYQDMYFWIISSNTEQGCFLPLNFCTFLGI
jgi:hypothetical protein